MKATIFYWAFQDFEPITGYKDRQEIPYEDVFEIAQKIFNEGLNVMVYHNHESTPGALATAIIIVNKNGKVTANGATIGTKEYDVRMIMQADWDAPLVEMYESVLAR